MALHEIPDDGRPHAPTTECGCGVTARQGVYRGQRRTILVHTPGPPPAAADDYDETFGGAQ